MTQLPTSVLSPPLLLATDGSPSAGVAAQLVCSIAALFGPQPHQEQAPVLVVVSVQPRSRQRLRRALQRGSEPLAVPPTDEQPAEPTTVAPVASAERSPVGLSLSQLTDWVGQVLRFPVPVSLQVRQGKPASEILNCARTCNAGLIAVGHRGVGGVRELLLGSVSTAIARYAPCSVLVARTNSEGTNTASLQHALLVIDYSLADQHAIAVTRQLVEAGIKTVTLLHIQPPLNASYLVAPMVSRTPNWQLSQSLQDAQREQGEQILQQAAHTLDGLNLSVQTRLHVGDAGPSICQLAQELGATLIIIGSDPTRRSLLAPLQAVRLPRRKNALPNQGRSILRNTRLSITEDYVIHYAPCPVLLCRAIAEAS